MASSEKLFEKIYYLDARITKLEAEVKTYSDLRNRIVEIVVVGCIVSLIVVALKFTNVIN